MPAKKKASKSASSRKVTKKKTATKKPAARKKVSGKKTTKKTATKKKPAAKKAAAKKAKKKAPAKKVAKKKASGKKTAKKKAAKKKVAKKKKAAAKKAPAKKPTKKKAAKKKVSKKKAPAKRVARKAAAKKAAPARARKKPAKRTMPRRARADMISGPIHGIEPYKPARNEEYMSDDQLEHFREILESWKQELMEEVDRTVHHMQDEAANFPDPNDRATQESEFGLELRTRDRERKLLRKINQALGRIDDGSYGYCEETGEEIGLKRLEARPVATLCLEAQERRELAERQFRDRDDRYR